MKRLFTPFTVVMLMLLFTFGISPEAIACSYKYKMNHYERLKEKLADLEADGSPQPQTTQVFTQICYSRRDIEYKFRNRPGKETPDLPDGYTEEDCETAIMNAGGSPQGPRGGGRGGTVGGAGFPGSDIPFWVWMRSHYDIDCDFTWEIIPDPSNPPGFSFSETSGTVTVSGFSSGAPLDVQVTLSIDPAVPAGTTAVFEIEFIDLCSGDPFGHEYSPFEITVIDGITVEPLEPIVELPNTNTVKARWRLTNPTNTTITKNYSFVGMPDPMSRMTFNNGSEYFITNAAPVDKTVTGGMVMIPPNGTVDIEWEIEPTEYCDPEMLGCCALEIDGAVCCVLLPTLSTEPDSQCGNVHPLSGEAEGGGVGMIVGDPGGTFEVFVETFPGQLLEEVVDALAFQAQDLFLHVNDFDFQPMVAGNVFGMMIPPDGFYEMISADVGLSWGVDTCLFSEPIDFVREVSALDATLEVAPNPTTGAAGIHFHLNQAYNITCRVYDLQGNELIQYTPAERLGAGEHEIMLPQISDLPPGMYFCTLESGGAVLTTKFIKQ